MKLDRWLQYGNCLVGYIYDSSQFPNGTRVLTQAVRFIDPVNFQAECLDGKYKLGEPGTVDEHNQPLLGSNRPATDKLILDPAYFLNPRG